MLEEILMTSEGSHEFAFFPGDCSIPELLLNSWQLKVLGGCDIAQDTVRGRSKGVDRNRIVVEEAGANGDFELSTRGIQLRD